MIKLKSILTESTPADDTIKGRSVDISREQTKLLLKRKTNSAWKRHLEEYRIFRGIGGSNNPYKFISPSKTKRESKNTLNIINSFLDIIPSWKNWPKRSNSIICSSSPQGAGWYGTVFQVFPFNGAKIGICSQSDFWESFPVIKERFENYDVDSLNYLFSDIYSLFQIPIDPWKFKVEDAKKLIDYLNETTKRHEDVKFLYTNLEDGRSTRSLLLVDMINHYKGGDWIEYFDDLFNPEKNNFKLTTIEEYSQLETPKREVWTDSNSLMINPHALKFVDDHKIGINVTNADGTKEFWPGKDEN